MKRHNLEKVRLEICCNSYFYRTKTILDLIEMGHQDGDPDKTQELYDLDNHADQENPNNDEYDK